MGRRFKTKGRLRIGVAVPCASNHISSLLSLLKTIDMGTLKPDVVCVSVAPAVVKHNAVIADVSSVDLSQYSFNVKFLVHKEPQNTAQNRNIAGMWLRDAGMDIISFIDADDLMHPQRLEIIKEALKKADAVAHNYINSLYGEGDPYHWEIITEPQIFYGKCNIGGCGFGLWITDCGPDVRNPRLHHGHISILSKVFSDTRFNETSIALCGRLSTSWEDSIFASDLITKGYRVAYVHDKLSKYYG